MTEIINLGEMARIKKQHAEEIAEKDARIAALTIELKDARIEANTLGGISSLLTLQLTDLGQTVRVMQEHLNTIQANILEMKSKLPK